MIEAANAPELRAKAAFLNAAQFHTVSDLIGRAFDLPATGEPQPIGSPCVPVVVNNAFALELYLKAIVILEAGDVKPTHDLSVLFSLVSDNLREHIRDEYDRLLQTPFGHSYSEICLGLYPVLNGSMSLDTVLPICRDAFAAWRYCHEGTSEGKFWLGGPITCAVRNVIRQLRPDWKPPVAAL